MQYPASGTTPQITPSSGPPLGAGFRPSDLPGIEDLWQRTQGDPDISIAVLDGPVDTSHPCFEGATLEEVQTLVPATGPSDHGTHVTSLILGQPGTRITGIAPGCRGLIAPVFTQRSDGHLKACSQQDLARAITQAVEAGARVINISGGELTSSGEPIDFLGNAIRQASKNNVLVVAATGNDGCECLHVPAALPAVLPVGASDLDGRPLGSSNWNDALEGIVAPGASIEGAMAGGRVGLMNGTSFATPLVAGVAALLFSLQKKYGMALDASAVREALLKSTSACELGSTTECRRLLRGKLNIRGAREHLLRSARSSTMEVRASGAAPLPRTQDPSQTNKGAIMSENMESGIQPQKADRGAESLVPSGEASPPATSEVTPSCAMEVTAQVEPSIDAGPMVVAESAPLAAPAAESAQAIIPSSIVQPTVMGFENPTGVSPSCQQVALFSPFPPGQKVFTIGKLYYDFGTEARRDYFIAQVRSQFIEQGIGDTFNQGMVYNPEVMIKYLFNIDQNVDLRTVDNLNEFKKEPTNQDASNALVWTLYIDQDPVYALIPEDQYALLSFVRLTDFLKDQGTSLDPATFRVAMAGVINGSTTLFNGTVVPTLAQVSRGMFAWDIKSLVEATSAGSGTHQAHDPDPEAGTDPVDDDLKDFLLRVYDALRNLGVSAEDRAKNFAATNAYQARQAFVWANSKGRKFKLDQIGASRSPICRRNSDCWDIKLTFFDPKQLFQTARQVFEYTIDVSDIIPVQVGEPRIYPIYGGPSS